jgi:hypothetical protein
MRLSPTQNEVESNPTNFRKENRMKLLWKKSRFKKRNNKNYFNL